MELLERAAPLAALGSRLVSATAGRGSMTLVAGEAGIGKTSLARAFCAAHEAGTQVLWGACDALRTPRPLGPLYDMARMAGGELATVMRSGDVAVHERFRSFLDALYSPLRPVIAVIEDVHWADEATLDLLVFVARRVADTNAVVLVTFRDDEAGLDHPLRRVLGTIGAAEALFRLRLQRLSAGAVARLAAPYDADGDRIYDITGGNPFFVDQMLAAGALGAVPETVRDAVLARTAGLSAAARSALEAVAVVPDGATVALVRAVTGTVTPPLGECARTGLLEVDRPRVRFRHELARLAVEQATPAERVPELHAAVLAHLTSRGGTDPARLAYHADLAEDPAAVLRHAPAAAQQAARLGAHREAAAQYERALPHIAALEPARQGELLEEYAAECLNINYAAGEPAAARALAIWRELGAWDRAAASLARFARFPRSLGRNQQARQQVRAAMALVADLPFGPGTATAYTYATLTHMLDGEYPEAITIGTRAIELARRHGSGWVLSQALNAVGCAYEFVDPHRSEAMLIRSIEVARAAGSDRSAAGAMMNLGASAAVARRYQAAGRWLREALEYTTERDLDVHRAYCVAWLARCAFEQGRWPEAAAHADEVLRQPGMQRARMVSLTVTALLGVRRGDPAAEPLLAEAWQLAVESGELQRLWPAAAARAEAMVLAGRPERIPPLVEETYRQAVTREHPWAVGELGYWLWRAGALDTLPGQAAEPYALQVGGDPLAAAKAWEVLGCPYESALALVDSGRTEDLRAALRTFHRLGARPAAGIVAKALRERGERRLPRGPQRRTAANPAGLTGREMEVLALVQAGSSNPEIAARLHLSPRTVHHHMTSILAKLGARSRHDAARLVPPIKEKCAGSEIN